MTKRVITNLFTGILLLALLLPFDFWKVAATTPAAPTARQLLSHITDLSAGGAHVCALTEDGGVQCWGRNVDGELGNGSMASSSLPVKVVGLSEGVSAIAAGGLHACALTAGGGVKCWGYNDHGQLGNGSATNSSTPVNVVGLSSGVSAISGGILFTCALMDGGGVKCWGRNDYGQLGNSTTISSTTPVDVTGLSGGVKAIAAGGDHACALLDGGGVKCWGYNGDGQLGNSTTISSTAPVNVASLVGVNAISSGNNHTCALIAGSVKCWGDNSYGQLGDGSITDRSTPVDVSGLPAGVSAIAGGGWHTCALTSAGGAKCWGSNGYGMLGDGSTTTRYTPVDVYGLTAGASALTAGDLFTCALADDGGVRCWGANWFGQLGNGSSGSRSSPVAVSGITDASAIASGYSHACALVETGGIQCWGFNIYGELGDGTNDSRSTPVAVSAIAGGVSAISTSNFHTCALVSGGVQCWGDNENGQLGNGTMTNSNLPVAVSGLSSGVRAISAGYQHTCALTDAGGVLCWGSNNSGQLGNPVPLSSSTPVTVTGLSSGVNAMIAGGYHTCALLDSGGVKCWGFNYSGQLGNRSTTGSNTPVDVSGLSSGISALAAGHEHTCALTTGGAVECWGENEDGQLGNNARDDSSVPVNVSGLSGGISKIAAGGQHTCALTTGGGIKCWGDNITGQVGGGAVSDSLTPLVVIGFSSGAGAVAAGVYHTCALTASGGVQCWGDNGSGALGDGSGFRSTPSAVLEGDHLSFIPLAIYSTISRR